MVQIEKLIGYTIPLYGNKRLLPYGSLIVADGTDKKTVRIMEERGRQYFTFKRKRYYIQNIGSLYSPNFQIFS